MIKNDIPRSLVDNPRLDNWIGFGADRTVNLLTGKVELGQGILTALTQLAADELCVSTQRIRVVSGHTGRSPEEVFTAGSMSVEVSGGSIRLVCAEIRGHMLQLAATKLGCAVNELDVSDGCFVRNGSETSLDYWQLADQADLARNFSGATALLPRTRHQAIGRHEPRADLAEKIFGTGFIHDIEMPGMQHARILRGPIRGAQLEVLGDIRHVRDGSVQLYRKGNFVAVLSDTEHAVNRAITALRNASTWRLPQVSGDYTSPHWLLDQPSEDRVIGPAGGWKDGPLPLTATYSRPFIAHGSIGPSCALALWRDNQLTVLTHSQGVGPLRKTMAGVLGLGMDAVTVSHRQGAGCYGQNGADDVALDAAMIALAHPNVPIRVLWLREDEMSVSPMGAAMAVRLGAELDAVGRPAHWQMEIWSCTHGRRPGMGGSANLMAATEIIGARTGETGDAPPFDIPDAAGGGGTRNAIAPYDLPDQTIRYHLLRQQPIHTSSMRGLGAQANVFAIESFIDELALQTESDPLSYRLSLLSEPRMRNVLQAVARMSDWEHRSPGGAGTGFGIAVSRYKNHAGFAAIVAEVDVEESVTLKRLWCAADVGLVVNPDGALNQIEGGMIQAASWTLKEQVTFDETGITSPTWEKYPILRFTEIPEIEVELLEGGGEEPLGVGEIVVGPTTAAIANAVANALGVRIRDLPLTRDRIMQALLTL